MYPDPAAAMDHQLERWTGEENGLIEDHIARQLDTLAEAEDQLNALKLRLAAEVEAVTPEEVKAARAAVVDRYSDQLEGLTAYIEEVTGAIKAQVTSYGASVKGAARHAVYSGGRDKWDGRTLMRLAKDTPAIWDAHTTGAPSVSIRRIRVTE